MVETALLGCMTWRGINSGQPDTMHKKRLGLKRDRKLERPPTTFFALNTKNDPTVKNVRHEMEVIPFLDYL